MLATLVANPFDKPGWVYEEKYDGIRVLAYKEDKHVSLLSRNDVDRTGNFPEVIAAITKLRPSSLLLDGEVVVFDRKNVSRFQLLQQSKGEVFYAARLATEDHASSINAAAALVLLAPCLFR